MVFMSYHILNSVWMCVVIGHCVCICCVRVVNFFCSVIREYSHVRYYQCATYNFLLCLRCSMYYVPLCFSPKNVTRSFSNGNKPNEGQTVLCIKCKKNFFYRFISYLILLLALYCVQVAGTYIMLLSFKLE